MMPRQQRRSLGGIEINRLPCFPEWLLRLGADGGLHDLGRDGPQLGCTLPHLIGTEVACLNGRGEAGTLQPHVGVQRLEELPASSRSPPST
jgi:hypothetical protein